MQTRHKSSVPRSFAFFLAKGRETTTLNDPFLLIEIEIPFALRCIQHLLLLCHALQNVWIPNRPILNQVHLPRQQRSKRSPQAEIVLYPRPNRNWLKLHQKIRIASLGIKILAQNRAKNRQSLHSINLAEACDFF